MLANQLKRVPTGFLGTRGKKANYNYINDDDLQVQLFEELQKEREMIANFIEDYEEQFHEQEKRKPTGFTGVRGKKSVNNDDYYEYEKRAPMGFTGVRGKKSEFPDFVSPQDKRVPVAGFFGMRGKKQPFVNVS